MFHFLTPTKYARKAATYAPKWLYRFFASRWIDYRWPRHLFIELTSRCQLSCKHCPRPDVSCDLPFWLFKKIVDEASLFGRRSFSLHLFGEPLLYPEIDDCIGYLKRRGHAVLLTTNGILAGRHINSLKTCDKIIWTQRKGVEIPKALWKNLLVRFFKEVHSAEDIKLWKSRGVEVEVKHLHNYGGEVSCARSMGKRWACYHPFLAPAVTANGSVVICCNDPHQRSVIGNIRTGTIESAWKKMEKIRSEHRKGVYKGICENCNCWETYPDLF